MENEGSKQECSWKAGSKEDWGRGSSEFWGRLRKEETRRAQGQDMGLSGGLRGLRVILSYMVAPRRIQWISKVDSEISNT